MPCKLPEASGGLLRVEQKGKRTDSKEEVKEAERKRNLNEEVEDEYRFTSQCQEFNGGGRLFGRDVEQNPEIDFSVASWSRRLLQMSDKIWKVKEIWKERRREAYVVELCR